MLGDFRSLKEFRVYKDKTIEEVSDITGLNRHAISRYEKGQSTPSIPKAFKLLKFYCVGINKVESFYLLCHHFNCSKSS